MTSVPASHMQSQIDSCNSILYEDEASGCQVGATDKAERFPRKWNDQRTPPMVFLSHNFNSNNWQEESVKYKD